MVMNKKIIEFNRWLFDNHLVPNKSFLWFVYDSNPKDVRFLQ